MKLERWLCIQSNGTCRITVNRPGLGFDEVAMRLEIEVPDAFFHKPTLSATIVIPPEAASPPELSAAVVEDARAAIETSTGLAVRLELVDTRTESDEDQP